MEEPRHALNNTEKWTVFTTTKKLEVHVLQKPAEKSFSPLFQSHILDPTFGITACPGSDGRLWRGIDNILHYGCNLTFKIHDDTSKSILRVVTR